MGIVVLKLAPVEEPSQGRFRTAFTLVELLVVLAVLSLLAALLMPAIGKARRLARATECKSNVRQLALAVALYVTDFDCYPLFGYAASDRMQYWTDLLAPLVLHRTAGDRVVAGSATVFECPSFRARVSCDVRSITYGYSDEGYAFQGLGRKMEFIGGQWTAVPVHEADVSVPSDMIVLGDGLARLRSGHLRTYALGLSRWQVANPMEHSYKDLTPEGLRQGDQFVRKAHDTRANVAFGDGHVETIPLRRLFEDESDGALKRWNRDQNPHRDWLVK